MRPLLLLFAFALSLAAKDIPVADIAALQSAVKAARPGDNIILREGEWRDASIIFTGEGTAAAPITLKAAVPGRTTLTGRSVLRIGGAHLVVDGLLFTEPASAPGDVIEFRKDSKQLAHHCRLTNCAVISTQPPSDKPREQRWVGVYGSENRVDHCVFQGKSGKGATFVVWLGAGNEGRHRIDHNYFGPRERLGGNGGETIRIGDSQTSMLTAACIVEHNLFEACNGEVECISNKSCGNIYRENTFLEVSGTLTLRHGNGCLVERNVFLGNNANGTGGVRVIGADHIVRGNYFAKLTGDGTRAAICMMLGIPNSPANRYFQVERARIEDNSIEDCEHPIVIGLSDDKDATLAPAETIFSGNQIACPKRTIIEALCSLAGITWQKNRFAGKALGIAATPGIEAGEPTITALKPIPRAEVGTNWQP